MRAFLLLSLLLIAGCSNPAKDAEDQYKIVSTSGSATDKCEAAKKVRDAWLQQKNTFEYQKWSAYAGVDCQRVELDRF